MIFVNVILMACMYMNTLVLTCEIYCLLVENGFEVMIHSSFPSLCIVENHWTVLEYNIHCNNYVGK